MSEAKEGNTVRVRYTGKLEDGTVFDTTAERGPLEFTLGEGKIIPGFEHAVLGMTPGDSKSVEVQPSEAYGPHQEELVHTVPRNMVPEEVDLQVGLQFQVSSADGSQQRVASVSSFDEETVTLDENHPLAGKEVVFDIELVEIVE